MNLLSFFRSCCRQRPSENETELAESLLIAEEIVEEKVEAVEEKKENSQTPQLSLYQIEQAQQINPAMDLLSAVLIGAARDYFWRNSNRFENVMPELFGTTLTQMLETALPMLGGNYISWKIIHSKSHYLTLRRQGLYRTTGITLASWFSIFFWNASDSFGTWLGSEKLGLSAVDAGYFAGAGNGVLETLIQNLFQSFWLSQPMDVLVTTLNALSGAVWKWVSQANTEYDPADPNTALTPSQDKENLTNLLIMLSVAATTTAMTILAWKLKKISCPRVIQESDDQTVNTELIPRRNLL